MADKREPVWIKYGHGLFEVKETELIKIQPDDDRYELACYLSMGPFQKIVICSKNFGVVAEYIRCADGPYGKRKKEYPWTPEYCLDLDPDYGYNPVTILTYLAQTSGAFKGENWALDAYADKTDRNPVIGLDRFWRWHICGPLYRNVHEDGEWKIKKKRNSTELKEIQDQPELKCNSIIN
jgi:hypothetical protein